MPHSHTDSLDSRKTSLLKTLTWYLSDMTLTWVIAFAVTREAKTALGIAVLQQTWEVALYYFHERVWVRVKEKRARTQI